MGDMVRRATAAGIIGRAEQLAQLDDVVAATRAGRGQVVLISGEAGVGKSRLVEELARRAPDDCLTLLGWCVEHGENVMPLAPFADLIRAVATSMTAADLAEITGPDLAALTCLVPDLSSTGPPDLPDGHLPVARLYSGVLATLLRLSEHRTVLVVLEDLHWADASSRELVSFLAPRLAQRPIALIITYRDDELHRRHPLKPCLASLQRSVRPEVLGLEPFTVDELAELVVALGQTPADRRFVEVLHERCGGNAFFAEELLAAGRPANRSAMLRDVVLTRTDGLDTDQMMVLETAAIAGSHVDLALLAVVCHLDDDVVAGAANQIVDAALWVHDGGTLRFRHELTREVIAGEVAPHQRSMLHSEVAGALQLLCPDRPGEIAHHWAMTGNQPRALEASVAAGRAAAGIGADNEALLQYERALELWEHVPRAAELVGCAHSELLLEAADAAGRARHFTTAIQHGRRAVNELDGGDPSVVGLACLRLLEWAWWSEDDGESGPLIERALGLVPADPPTGARALAMTWHARLLLDRGASNAGERAQSALEMARSCGEVRAEVHALITVGAHRSLHGDPVGLEHIHEALRLAIERRLSQEACRAYFTLAVCLDEDGRHHDVVALEQDAVDHCAAAGMYRMYGVMIEFHVIRSYARLGRWRAVEDRVERLRNHFGSLDIEHVWLAGSWGLVLVRQGRLEGVRELIADDIASMHDHHDVIGAAATTMIELAAAEGRWSDIPDAVNTALDRILLRTLLPHHVDLVVELVATAVGALADRPVRASPRNDENGDSTDRANCVAWVSRVESAYAAGVRTPRPRAAARLALGQAELARLLDEPSAPLWRRLVEAWTELDAAYEAAYARWRLAGALLAGADHRAPATRSEVRALLTDAAEWARPMGAVPLLTQIETLARRAHLPLNAGSTDRTTLPADTTNNTFGLSAREMEVLRLVAAGYSNGEIGQALYISRKTASVHVSNILRKLDVTSRLQAGTIAARAGLVNR